MRQELRFAIAAVTLAGASFSLASCGIFGGRVASNRTPPPVARAPAREAPARPPQATDAIAASDAVWGLRSGLNVAALSCRGSGRQAVAPAYARMLQRHRDLLAAAYRRELGKQAISVFDRQQTRVYNTFANQASPVRFCNTASVVAERANGLDSARFAVAAPGLLGQLRASLRRP